MNVMDVVLHMAAVGAFALSVISLFEDRFADSAGWQPYEISESIARHLIKNELQRKNLNVDIGEQEVGCVDGNYHFSLFMNNETNVLSVSKMGGFVRWEKFIN